MGPCFNPNTGRPKKYFSGIAVCAFVVNVLIMNEIGVAAFY